MDIKKGRNLHKEFPRREVFSRYEIIPIGISNLLLIMDIGFLQQHDVKQFILTPTCKYDFNQLGDWLCSQPIGKGNFRVFVPIKGMKINRL